jgi:hypothetical protein
LKNTDWDEGPARTGGPRGIDPNLFERHFLLSQKKKKKKKEKRKQGRKEEKLAGRYIYSFAPLFYSNCYFVVCGHVYGPDNLIYFFFFTIYKD